MSANLTDDYLQLMKLALTGLTEAKPTMAALQEDKTVQIRPAVLEQRLAGRDWPANGLTMVGMKRLDNVQSCIERVLADEVPGDLVETGVWRGGTAMFMRAVLKAHGVMDRIVYAADSFKGLPPPDDDRFPADAGVELHEWDFLSVPLEAVKESFSRFGLLDDQVRFVEGWFEDTMPTLAGRRWALIRLDGDLYGSTMTVLESLYPDLSPDGYLIVDDFNLEQCRQAVEDYRKAHGIRDEIHEVDWTGIYWRKAGTGDG
jgi:Macrocin-O-methyltransferase (TylF)